MGSGISLDRIRLRNQAPEPPQENHARLGTFLRRQGEGAVAEWWEDINRIRQGGWYGGSPEPERVQRGLYLLEKIHNWAVS